MTFKPTKSPTPAIDWELSLKLAGNKQDLAKEIMNVLVTTLPNDIHDIVKSKNDPNVLLQRVHKLHGAVSYSGLIRLKKLLAEFEQSLKNEHFSNLEAYLDTLQDETQKVLAEFAETNTYDR